MARRFIAISLTAFASCSFVDDFDKFHLATSTDSDSGAPDATVADAARDSGPTTTMDSGARDGAIDANVPSFCDAPCDDGDPCTIDRCNVTTCEFMVIDADGDGYSPGMCKPGSSAVGGDCDDTNSAAHPGGTEVCDGADNDCNEVIDDGFSTVQCYPDLDRDGFANLDAKPVTTCGASCGDAQVLVTDPADRTKHDCWDDPLTGGEDVYPGQKTYFDRGYGPGGKAERKFDYDCNGQVDPQYVRLVGCGLIGLLCGGNNGFTSDVPNCGETGEFLDCGIATLCNVKTESRQQKCR